MKQVININFQGQVVPIEVTAFDIIKEYIESLRRHFEKEEGRDEIINDIESRIGELFQERLKAGATCITDDDVHAIIRNMGRPEDFETDEVSEDTGKEDQKDHSGSQRQYTYQGAAKKLYRNENDKVIGGVCSGLADYFGIDVAVIRIVFVILAISFGFGILPYIILWIAVPSTASTEIGGYRKKLYRDPDEKLIAGVCSGIAHYFGINVWIPRVIFLLPFLSFISFWDHFHFIKFGFGPGLFIIYIILWAVIPEAVTTSEKLEMKGEKVDLNSIRDSIVDEMKGVKERAKKFGKEASAFASQKGKEMGADIEMAVKRNRNSLGDAIALIFKIVGYLILSLIAMVVVLSLLALAIYSIGVFPLKSFVITDGWQNVAAWGTLLLFIAVPIIGIITWIIRRIAGVRKNSKLVSRTFISLWVLGWISFFALISLVGRDFRSPNHFVEQEVPLTNPVVQKLELTSLQPGKSKIFYRNWIQFEPFEGISEEDTLYVKNISIQILKSPNDSFRVTMIKMARGSNKANADTLAAKIKVNFTQQDSLLILDRGIAINKTDKFRNQRLLITVYVPVGKIIRIDNSIGKSRQVSIEGPWRGGDWEFEFDDEDDDNEWDTDEDYIMRPDGLYDMEGHRAFNPHRSMNRRADHEWNTSDDRQHSSPTNRDQHSTPAAPLMNGDSGKINKNNMPEPGIQQLKDSLENQRQEIDKKLKQLNAEYSIKVPSFTYMVTTYNPFLM